MIKVMQNKFGPKNGNCFAACVASITEIPLKKVDRGIPENGWFPVWCDILKEFNLSLIMMTWPDCGVAVSGKEYIIATGMNKKGTCNHAVVAELTHDHDLQQTWLEIVHDPMGKEHLNIESIKTIGLIR